MTIPNQSKTSVTIACPDTTTMRPQTRRQTSLDSPGWYNTEGGMTLEDFTLRFTTYQKRFERYQNRCAQNIVMALIGPTPVALFVFNPIALLIWLLVGIWVVAGKRVD